MSEGEGQDDLQQKTEKFLREFFSKGESLVRELIIENDQLRARIAALPQVQTPSRTNNLDTSVVEKLMTRVAALERECDEIRRLAGNVEAQSGGFRDRLESLEEEHYHLACRHVASSQFQSALTLDEVLRTATEILLNFIGVGKFTLFAVDEERQTLFPVIREGGEVREVDELPMHEGLAVQLAKAGRPWSPGDDLHDDASRIANLPLVAGTRLMGIARLEAFLAQKGEFTSYDLELLGLISERAGIGIENAWIRAHAKEVPLQRDAIEHLVTT